MSIFESMQKLNRKVIISGAPGTGKTSLINAIQNQTSYSTFPEIARQVIKAELDKNTTVVPWLDLEAFSKKILQLQISDYLNSTDTCFFDRGIPDVFAYLNAGKVDSFQELNEALIKYRYHNKVFLTPPWKEIYDQDNERKESFEQACIIHEYIESAYLSLNYDVIHVPIDTIDNRLNFVLSHYE